MDFLKTITGKILSGLIAVAVIIAGISWFQMDTTTRSELLSGSGKILGWFAIVLLLPWATFFLIGRVARAGKNSAGAMLVAGYTLLEALLLAWMFNWSIGGGWVYFLLGLLVAAVYNLFTCDWIAEKVEG
jgi:hypothetical protein